MTFYDPVFLRDLYANENLLQKALLLRQRCGAISVDGLCGPSGFKAALNQLLFRDDLPEISAL